MEEESWTPPPPHSVQIDVDGAVRHQHQAACGGVIRNAQGEWLMEFCKSLGQHSVIEAEIQAIMLGLKMGHQMGLQKVLIYSDSLNAISILMRDCPMDHPLRNIIGETRDLLFNDWNVELHHTSRDNISCADYMAKEGHNVAVEDGVVMTPTIPQGCLHLALRDQGSIHG
ncbi:hypothetical protein QN277_027525 [Acacia crassicarpa]|uniref:RNase H type-1 domain-containing protein n=1 Tax=Acacia crassicarpa TaxID=499986 RepID=A0AAE1MJ33_9FABA|nr:hypothetical protein QN277_027525 [Acacia crassicarpa]